VTRSHGINNQDCQDFESIPTPSKTVHTKFEASSLT
jgi:hypothetical protein